VKMPAVGYAAGFLGDAVMLGLAFYILRSGHSPMRIEETGLMVFCGLAGAVFALAPFFLEHRAAVRMAETGTLVSTLDQINGVQEIARQIGEATSQWQTVQDHSARTVGLAREIAERMAAETANFTKFLQEANGTENRNLRLENEKLRREEGEFLQIIVRMLDHTFALHQAAVRSAQPGLIEQLGHFQAACRDVARRIGLVPFAPAPNELFDAKIHQSAEAQAMPVSNARIRETIATGYTYQGTLIRPALVALQTQAAVAPRENTAGDTDLLELENAGASGRPAMKEKTLL